MAASLITMVTYVNINAALQTAYTVKQMAFRYYARHAKKGDSARIAYLTVAMVVKAELLSVTRGLEHAK